MSYAVMPMADYKNLCDKVREKTNTTRAIKSGELPQKIEDVYYAGQLTVLSSSEVLRGSVQGEAISITDVSPVEHNVGVKTDMGGVKLTVCGKNLFNVSKITDTEYITNNGDGSITIKDGATSRRLNQRLCELCPALKAGDVVVLSGDTSSKAGSKISIGAIWEFGKARTITEANLQNYVYFYCDSSVDEHTISNLQIEYGNTTTEYEPYKEPIKYTSSADGMVSGVKSIYPSMSFTTDTEGVNISVNYFKDIDKAVQEANDK